MSLLLPVLIGLLLLVTVAAVVATVTLTSKASLSDTERSELVRLRTLVEDLKELAWDHREIDPDLSTIVIDKIRSSERGGPSLP